MDRTDYHWESKWILHIILDYKILVCRTKECKIQECKTKVCKIKEFKIQEYKIKQCKTQECKILGCKGKELNHLIPKLDRQLDLERNKGSGTIHCHRNL